MIQKIALIGMLLTSTVATASLRDVPPLPHLPPAEDLQPRVTAETNRCIPQIEETFGQEWPRNSNGEPKHLSIRIAPRKDVCDGRLMGCTSSRATIELANEYFLSGVRNFETTVCHELHHGFMRVVMGRNYRSVPRWLREGSAVYLSGEFENKLHEALAKDFNSVESRINGLEGRHSLDDYMEDALTFVNLERRFGRKKVTEFFREYVRTAQLNRTIQNHFGMTQSEFFEWTRREGRTYLTELKRNWDERLTLVLNGRAERRDRVGLLEGILPRNAALDKTNITVQRGFAAYKLIQAYAMRPDSQGLALQRATELLSVPSLYYGGLTAQVRALTGRLLYQSQRWNEALEQYSLIRAYHVEKPVLQLSVETAMGRTLFGAERWSDALFWLDRYPVVGTWVDASIFYLRGIASYQICRDGDARDRLRESAHRGGRFGRNAGEALIALREGRPIVGTPARTCSR